MGKIATSLLLQLINNNIDSEINQTKILEPQLVIRNSSKKNE